MKKLAVWSVIKMDGFHVITAMQAGQMIGPEFTYIVLVAEGGL